MHTRNRHQGQYDFDELRKSFPELDRYLSKNKYGDVSVDFANPKAVIALNRALLKKYYGLSEWSIPSSFLCPPIPGRADYIHHIADLLSQNVLQSGISQKPMRGLDIGVGANCIYPILGYFEYGWNFVGSDINPIALEAAQKNIEANASLSSAIQLRRQMHGDRIFSGIVHVEDYFDFTMCNPPFHSSAEDAQKGTKRKWKNLGKPGNEKPVHEKQLVNFGGQSSELWCSGGELAFIHRMIQESSDFKLQCGWFSTLVSKKETLPEIDRAIKKVKAKNWVTLDMSQGQKKSRVVAWTFKDF